MAVETIFVQIASYRDPECRETIRNLYMQAEHPENISIGINWQFMPEDHFEPLYDNQPFRNQIRIVKHLATNSKGVCWAREKTQQLYNGETFTMQIDSHMRFIKHWDSELLEMYKKIQATGVDKILISHYPPNFTLDGKFDSWQGKMSPYIRNDGIVFFKLSGYTIDQDDSFPKTSASMAAGFWFSEGSGINTVTYDPNIYFHGEEVTLSVRYWTHGWNIYNPSKIIVHHLFKTTVDKQTGEKKATREIKIHRDDNPDYKDLEANSIKRIKHLLGTEQNDTLKDTVSQGYFGNERNIYQYENFSGINFKTLTRNHFARLGYYFEEALPPSKDETDKFLDSFETQIWKTSTPQATKKFEETLHLLNVNAITDIAPNSHHFLQDLSDHINYTGLLNSHEAVIQKRFLTRDETSRLYLYNHLLQMPLPKTRMIVCHNFFEYAPIKISWGFLRSIARSKVAYLCTSSLTSSPSKLTQTPFYFPHPKLTVTLDKTQSIHIWDIQQIEIFTLPMGERYSSLRYDIIEKLQFAISELERAFVNKHQLFNQLLLLIDQHINSSEPREFSKQDEFKHYLNGYENHLELIFLLRYWTNWDKIFELIPKITKEDIDKQFVIALSNEFIRLKTLN